MKSCCRAVPQILGFGLLVILNTALIKDGIGKIVTGLCTEENGLCGLCVKF
ncbi:MAG: hypothetical protein V3S41_02865 [Spirochaetia bacterium]